MTNQDLTLLGILVDHSGSMRECRSDMEGGLNTLIEDQKKQGGHCEVTLAEFDDQYDLLWPVQDLKRVGQYELQPAGMTALLDAMGKFITYVGDVLRERHPSLRPGRVLIVVVTDGYENHSKEWTKTQIKKLVEEQQDQWKWEFLFLGANIDAVGEAGKIGIRAANAVTFDTHLQPGVYTSSVSNKISDYRTTGNLAGFTEQDREDMMQGFKSES